jgi:hypothetical protein
MKFNRLTVTLMVALAVAFSSRRLPVQKPEPRRVIHLEFAAENLPGGLEWRDRV